MSDDRQLARREPEPRRIEVSADDVLPPGVHVETVGRPITGESATHVWYDEAAGITHEEFQRIADRLARDEGLRQAAEHTRKVRERMESDPVYRAEIHRGIMGIEDPGLRRTLMEEFHR